MKHSEVLSRYVNTGSQIPEEQYDRLTPSLKRSYKRIREIVGYDDWKFNRWEFKMLSDDEKIKFIETEGEKLDDNLINVLFKYSNDKDLIATKIIELGKSISKKQYLELSPLIQKSYRGILGVVGYDGWEYEYLTDDERIKFIETEGKKYEKLDDNLIYVLHKYSNDIDLIATKIIEKLGNRLNSDEIDYLIYRSNNKDLIATKIIELGVQISEEEYIKLSPLIQKSYLRMRGLVGYKSWEFEYLTDDERIKFIETEGEELENYEIHSLLKYSNDKDLIATKIIDAKGKKLYYNIISYLLDYSKNKDLIATKIIILKGKELDEYFIRSLLYHSENKDDIAIKIIETIGKRFYNDSEINSLLDYSENKDLIATKIIEVGLQIPEKQYDILSQSLQKFYKRMRGVHGYSDWEFKLLNDNEKIKYIETEGEELKDYEIRSLLKYSNDKDLIITKIIQIKGKSLSGLGILTLFKNSEDKQLIKNLLLQNDVDYKKINDSIIRLKIDIPLIPDNYQSMLNEIRRIKQIMG
jgi:hypothetical protein